MDNYTLELEGVWKGYKVYYKYFDMIKEAEAKGETLYIGLPEYVLEDKNKKLRDATYDEVLEIMGYLNSQ